VFIYACECRRAFGNRYYTIRVSRNIRNELIPVRNSTISTAERLTSNKRLYSDFNKE